VKGSAAPSCGGACMRVENARVKCDAIQYSTMEGYPCIDTICMLEAAVVLRSACTPAAVALVLC
jgi:hypothetical protein